MESINTASATTFDCVSNRQYAQYHNRLIAMIEFDYANISHMSVTCCFESRCFPIIASLRLEHDDKIDS